jgi:hypothetical protein
MRAVVLVFAGVLAGCAELPPVESPPVVSAEAPPLDPRFAAVVQRVSAMVEDPRLAEATARRGLSLVNVTWEDTGRAMGSALGPNISDFTLQIRHRVVRTHPELIDGMPAAWFEAPELDPTTGEDVVQWQETLMPVIRHPNFTDVTGDVPADRFFVPVGNARGEALRSVPLLDVLRDLGRYASTPASLSGKPGATRIDLSADRDTHFLVSAQALFLPIPERGAAEFNPVLFNYQSVPGSPAVLTILVTREGTSIAVIENRGEDQGLHWGQELYFNDGGQRATFSAQRRADVARRIAAQGWPRTAAERSMLGRGADVMALIQVPLVHANRGVLGGLGYGYEFDDDPLSGGLGLFGPSDEAIHVRPGPMRSTLDRAVIGHGARLGPFLEGHETALVRDAAFPIRITVQFYKATSTGEVTERDLDGIATSLASVYAHADYVGSLVMPADDAQRPTAWQHVPGEWFPW